MMYGDSQQHQHQQQQQGGDFHRGPPPPPPLMMRQPSASSTNIAPEHHHPSGPAHSLPPYDGMVPVKCCLCIPFNSFIIVLFRLVAWNLKESER